MIGSGWANNCGVELFTNGWILCSTSGVEVIEAQPGGGSSKHKPKPSLHAQALREDKEIVEIIQAFITRLM